MQNLTKQCATIFFLATAAVAVMPMTAMADRVMTKQDSHSHGHKAKVVKKQSHRHAVGHRFAKQDVIVVKDWQKRGLPRPDRDEVYVTNGGSIYLAAAATLLVKALIN
ncbi:RcnB family protein [Rhodobacteraceae bacterium D3-12]|nr:RcnB family protein [Rhodobacteraceae bacterium D3-12]